MKKVIIKTAGAILLCLALLASSAMALAPAGGNTAAVPSDGGRMVISEAGEYTLTGSMRGTVYVDPGSMDGQPMNGGMQPGGNR